MKFKEAAELFENIDKTLYVGSLDGGETMIAEDHWYIHTTTNTNEAAWRTLSKWKEEGMGGTPYDVDELTLAEVL